MLKIKEARERLEDLGHDPFLVEGANSLYHYFVCYQCGWRLAVDKKHNIIHGKVQKESLYTGFKEGFRYLTCKQCL